MGRRSKTSILAGATLLALTMIYAPATSIGVPWLVRKGLAAWQAQVPGLKVTWTSILCNPFTLTLKVRQLAILYAGRELLAAERIQVSPSSGSLAGRALIIREITLQNVTADMRWDANGYLDIEQIMPRRADGGDHGHLAWRIDHLSLDALQIRVAAAGTLAAPLDVIVPRIELDHIGSRDPDGRFSFDLHGRNAGQRVWDLHWQGRVDTAPLTSAGQFRLTELSLPWVGQAFGNRWPLQARRGQADVEAHYSLTDVAGRRRFALQDTTLEIRDFDAVGTARAPPEVSLRRLSARVSRIDGMQHQVIGGAITLESPEILMHREPDGDLDLLRLVREWFEPGASAPPPAPAWSVSWPLAAVSHTVVRLADSSAAGAGEWRLPAMDLRITNLQTAGATAMQLVARGPGLARDGGRATGAWNIEGQMQPASSALKVQWRLQNLDLRVLDALPRLRSMIEVKAGELTAFGRIDGNLHHPENLAGMVEGSMHRVALKGPTVGAWSAEQVALGPVRLAPARERGGTSRLTAPVIRVSALTWDIERGALHLLGAAHGLTLQGMSGDRAGRHVTLRDVNASAGHADLLGGARTLHLGWHAFDVARASADLAAQRFVAGAVTGTGWSWRGRLPWIHLSTFALTDVHSDSRLRRIDLGKIRVSGGRVLLAQDHAGAIEPFSEVDSLLSLRNAPAVPANVVASAQRAARPWRFALAGAEIRLRSLRLGPGLAPPPARIVSQLALRTGPWSSGAPRPLRTHLEFGLGAGQWHWDGEFTPLPLALDGQLVVQNLELPPLAILLMRDRNARIDRGSVSLSGTVGVHRRLDSYAWHYAGALRAVDGGIVDGDGQELASWATASIPTLAADWQSGLTIPRLDLDGLLARITILPDHRINLASMLQGREPSTGSSLPRGPVPAPAPWPVHIDQLDLTRGRIDFEDETLATPFHAAVHDLAGTIGPFASDAARARARIQLSGHVNDYGHVDVQGSLIPLQRPQQGDVRVHFSRIELPTLNPYAAQIAGYRVDQGMLDLKLHYTLDQGRIDGDNRARIDQLILGPRVRYGAAPDLPLRAIVDVLRNDRDEIDLDVPVRGNLNDPDFVLSDVAVKALQDALRKTLESPFEFVAALLGRDSEQLRHIDFRAHTAVLDAADEEKLRTIGHALADHQKLLVFIQPTYDRVADAAGPQHAGAAAAHGHLRSLALRRGEAIKKTLVNAGVREHRILIDEPADLPEARAGTVRTSLELKAP